MPPGMLPEMYDLSDLPSSVVAAAAAVALPEDDELSNSVIHFEEHAEHAEYFNNSVESAEPDAVQSWRRTTLTSSSPGKSPAAAVRLSTTAGAATAVAAAQHTALQKMAAADVVVANIQRLRVLKLQGLFPRYAALLTASVDSSHISASHHALFLQLPRICGNLTDRIQGSSGLGCSCNSVVYKMNSAGQNRWLHGSCKLVLAPSDVHVN